MYNMSITVTSTIPFEDDLEFNDCVHRILECTYDNSPGAETRPISHEDVAGALRLIWKHLGGTIRPTWHEEMQAKEKR